MPRREKRSSECLKISPCLCENRVSGAVRSNINAHGSVSRCIRVWVGALSRTNTMCGDNGMMLSVAAG
jgi:hypothetical protein